VAAAAFPTDQGHHVGDDDRPEHLYRLQRMHGRPVKARTTCRSSARIRC
jgi:hypothetical protein